MKRLATVNGIWSQIYYKKENGKRGIGYIPTSVLENTAAEEKTEESKVAKVDGEEAGTIHKSEGKGVFAEAVDGVTAQKGAAVSGVQVGTPIAVSSDATLKPLGTFKITHYCPCSICCGPWANGVTSTGVDGYDESYDCCRSYTDSIWFESCDQWTGLCCRGLWRSDPDQLH